MKPELWKEVQRIFVGALDHPTAEREAYARAESRGNKEVLDEVLRLLAAKPPEHEFIEPPSSDEPRPGFGLPGRLGEFELLEEIGRGAMGVVYRAIQQPLGRAVAVKVLPPGFALSQRKIDRFLREARAAAKLNHPHVVPIITVGEDRGVRYFAMEYVEGHNLAVELKCIRMALVGVDVRPSHLPDCRSLEYFRSVSSMVRDVADAIHHAHEHGVIHRDIKPSNLQLDPDGDIHVVDFGLAHDEAQATLTKSGDVAGTPHYMSPEQARAHRHQIDHRTDIYSIGVVLYELLTLKRPFEGKSSTEVLHNILQSEATGIRRLNKRVPRDLELICTTAMAKDLRDRYRSAAELRDDIDCFLAHQAVLHARPVPAWRRFQRRCHQHRAALIAMACTLVALVVGAWLMAVLSVPHVEVTVTSDADGDQVYVQQVELETSRLGDRRAIGTTPLHGHTMKPGYYRFTVDRAGFGYAELSRLLIRDGEHYQVHASVTPASEDHANMVFLPAGPAPIGFDDPAFKQYDQRTEMVQAFWIDRFEVSNAEYRAFLESLDEDQREGFEPYHWRDEWWLSNYDPAWDDLPVVGVWIPGATAYAEWVGKRLPTYYEWERAVRGVEARSWPWDGEGDRASERAVYDRAPLHETWWRNYLMHAAPVRSLETKDGTLEDQVPSGLLHVLGNAREWTETIEVNWVDGDPHPSFATRVVKGGDWETSRSSVGLAGVSTASARFERQLGFRCARSELPERD